MGSLAPFAAAVAFAARAAAGECDDAAHRGLDFWLGRWEVVSEGETIAESVIERAADACAIVEHYRQRDGYTGTSINFYDPVLGRWRQTWIDSKGSAGEFVGEPGENSMSFTGETHRSDGRRVQRKMRLSLEGDGTIRQHSLASFDGRQWKEHYDFRYRKAP